MKKEIKILLIYVGVMSVVELFDFLWQIDSYSFAVGGSVCILTDLLFKGFIEK